MYTGIPSEQCRFLWTEIDQKSNEVSLSRIDFFFDEWVLVGLAFSYSETTLRKSMGICEGQKRSICLQRHENILAVDVSRPGELTATGIALVVVSRLIMAVDISPHNRKRKLMTLNRFTLTRGKMLLSTGQTSPGAPAARTWNP